MGNRPRRAAYLGIETDTRRHESVNHSAEQWVVGDVHTNGIECVWSLFKRSIVGSFHKTSAKHMDPYLQELQWRFNNRKNPHISPRHPRPDRQDRSHDLPDAGRRRNGLRLR